MKLALTVLLLSIDSSFSFAFTPSNSAVRTITTTRIASTTDRTVEAQTTSSSDDDDVFSAFADSLDEDDLFDDKESSEDKNGTTPWQENLEMLMDPSTPVAKRQILLSDLMNANGDIRNDVQNALKDRKIDNLLTPTGKKLQDGTRAVARQITTDILPTIAAAASSNKPPSNFVPEELPTLVPKIGSRILDAVSNQAKKQLETIQADLADPTRIPERISKQTADLATEAKNVFLETPEGLVGPEYTVISENEGYEIREYVGYDVASTSMSKVGEPYSMDDITKGGAAFNALAAYLFGANDEGKIMEMTTPVSTTSVGEMRFYLKGDGGVTDFPQPLSPEGTFNEQGVVKIVEVPPARLAVAKFTGFVTEGEVSRQKDALLSRLSMDGVEVDTPHGTIIPHIIFQYNPPYTIPIVRRNEIAIPVRSEEDIVKNSDLESEWQAAFGEDDDEDEDDDYDDDIAPSDVE